MGLTVTRTPGQQIQLKIEPGTTAQDLWEALQEGITIRLEIAPGVTPDELYNALLDGITVRLVDVSGSKAKIDVTAPQELQMYRPEASAT